MAVKDMYFSDSLDIGALDEMLNNDYEGETLISGAIVIKAYNIQPEGFTLTYHRSSISYEGYLRISLIGEESKMGEVEKKIKEALGVEQIQKRLEATQRQIDLLEKNIEDAQKSEDFFPPKIYRTRIQKYESQIEELQTEITKHQKELELIP